MTSETAETAPYRSADVPVEQRVADLLERMTRAEKIAQLGELDLPLEAELLVTGEPRHISARSRYLTSVSVS